MNLMTGALREVVISEIRDEADGIRSYQLRCLHGRALDPALPGAHVDVHLGNGLVRQYSLCHDPAAHEFYVIAVKREVTSRGGSQWLHERAQLGDRLTISAPRSLLAPALAPHHLLIAGGIGITPLYSLAQHFRMQGLSFALHYFARSHAQAAFADALSDNGFANHVHFHYGIEPPELGGVLDKILDYKIRGSHIYVCGPAPFMAAVRARAAASWPPDAIHEEKFIADAASARGFAFKVVLASSGEVIDIPEDRGILDVLMEKGHHIEHSCEQGFCGSCMTAVLDGQPDHRDTFLTPDERASGKWIMPCVSRAASAILALDL